MGWAGIVYRALRYDEIRGTFENGLFAKNPVARKSALQHVLEGSNPDFASQFISATRNRQLAEKWARKAGTAVAAIDLRRLDTSVSDLSNSAGRVRYLGDASRVLPGHDIHRANRLARGASELLIEQHVTREAIVGLKLFNQ